MTATIWIRQLRLSAAWRSAGKERFVLHAACAQTAQPLMAHNILMTSGAHVPQQIFPSVLPTASQPYFCSAHRHCCSICS